MDKRTLGKTNCDISSISFGGAAISGKAGGYAIGDIDEKDAISLVHRAVELGINHFDTAPIYGFGESEKRLGKALKCYRDDIFITSKSGINWHDNMRVDIDNSAATTRKMLEQSLRDLDTDYIDFYFIHWPDPRVDIRYPMEVLSKAKREGKIKHIGLSNTNHQDFKDAMEIDDVEIIQGQYNFLHPDVGVLKDIIEEYNLGVMTWGSYHKGLLTGRVHKDRQYEKSDGRSKSPWWKRSEVNKELDIFAPIQEQLLARDIKLVSFALGAILKEKYISSAMVGMRKIEYLEQTIKALKHLPSNDIYDEFAIS